MKCFALWAFVALASPAFAGATDLEGGPADWYSHSRTRGLLPERHLLGTERNLLDCEYCIIPEGCANPESLFTCTGNPPAQGASKKQIKKFNNRFQRCVDWACGFGYTVPSTCDDKVWFYTCVQDPTKPMHNCPEGDFDETFECCTDNFCGPPQWCKDIGNGQTWADYWTLCRLTDPDPGHDYCVDTICGEPPASVVPKGCADVDAFIDCAGDPPTTGAPRSEIDEYNNRFAACADEHCDYDYSPPEGCDDDVWFFDCVQDPTNSMYNCPDGGGSDTQECCTEQWCGPPQWCKDLGDGTIWANYWLQCRLNDPDPGHQYCVDEICGEEPDPCPFCIVPDGCAEEDDFKMCTGSPPAEGAPRSEIAEFNTKFAECVALHCDFDYTAPEGCDDRVWFYDCVQDPTSESYGCPAGGGSDTQDCCAEKYCGPPQWCKDLGNGEIWSDYWLQCRLRDPDPGHEYCVTAFCGTIPDGCAALEEFRMCTGNPPVEGAPRQEISDYNDVFADCVAAHCDFDYTHPTGCDDRVWFYDCVQDPLNPSFNCPDGGGMDTQDCCGEQFCGPPQWCKDIGDGTLWANYWLQCRLNDPDPGHQYCVDEICGDEPDYMTVDIVGSEPTGAPTEAPGFEIVPDGCADEEAFKECTGEPPATGAPRSDIAKFNEVFAACVAEHCDFDYSAPEGCDDRVWFYDCVQDPTNSMYNCPSGGGSDTQECCTEQWCGPPQWCKDLDNGQLWSDYWLLCRINDPDPGHQYCVDEICGEEPDPCPFCIVPDGCAEEDEFKACTGSPPAEGAPRSEIAEFNEVFAGCVEEHCDFDYTAPEGCDDRVWFYDCVQDPTSESYGCPAGGGSDTQECCEDKYCGPPQWCKDIGNGQLWSDYWLECRLTDPDPGHDYCVDTICGNPPTVAPTAAPTPDCEYCIVPEGCANVYEFKSCSGDPPAQGIPQYRKAVEAYNELFKSCVEEWCEFDYTIPDGCDDRVWFYTCVQDPTKPMHGCPEGDFDETFQCCTDNFCGPPQWCKDIGNGQTWADYWMLCRLTEPDPGHEYCVDTICGEEPPPY